MCVCIYIYIYIISANPNIMSIFGMGATPGFMLNDIKLDIVIISNEDNIQLCQFNIVIL